MTTTRPRPDDPVTAFTNGDGTTRAHSEDHGRLIYTAVNVRGKGAVGDGVTDDSAAIQTALNTGQPVYFPSGTYFLAEGTSLTIPYSNTRLIGGNRWNTKISSKNAYALRTVSTSGITVEHLGFTLRSGSTSGGALLFDSTSQAVLNDLAGDGVSTSTDPIFYLAGCVNDHVRRVQAQQGGPGIKLITGGSTVSFANANTIKECRVASTAGSTTPAIYVEGTRNRIRDCIVETNDGYGIEVHGNAHTIEGVWFEDNSNHNIYVPAAQQVSALLIQGNQFNGTYHNHMGARHISLGNVTSSGTDVNALILANEFQDLADSGINLYIGTNWEHVVVVANRKLWNAAVTDNGSDTIAFGNFDPSNQGPATFGGNAYDQLHIKTRRAAAASGGSPTSAESQLSASDATGTNYFMVGSRGYPIFRTGATLTSSDELETKSWADYFDPADGLLKSRIRDGSGVYSTQKRSYGVLGSAYTPTNVTTDRVYDANATTTDELADVLGTLLADLKAAGILP